MAIVDKIMVEVFNVAARGLDGTQTNTPTATSAAAASSTSATSTSTPTPNPGGNSQSPLLFFVALGFGVVFTNLWIIVGVKYCFRYNARNRALARGEDGEPINLEAMPRPHRRRREKKLMTMDEVNERFPMLKYKTWVATRASEGLPTAGGVAATSSRPASLVDAEGSLEMPSSPSSPTHKEPEDRPLTAKSTTAPEINPTIPDKTGLDEAPAEDSKKSTEVTVEKKADESAPMPTLTEVETTATDARKDSGEEEDDDEDQMLALAPEMVANPGDSCAICIDNLEPEDDVRGLTCGHAFHAGCLDPWLTSRRACCPLCKADYFVPKPRPEGEAAEPERLTGRTRTRVTAMAVPPRSAWMLFQNPRSAAASRAVWPAMHFPQGQSPQERSRSRREGRRGQNTEPNQDTPAGNTDTVQEPRSRGLFGNPFGRLRMPGRRNQNPDVEAGTQPTRPQYGTSATVTASPAPLEDVVVR